MPRKKPKVKMAVLFVRLPDSMHTKIMQASIRNGRSMSKEAIALLQKGLDNS